MTASVIVLGSANIDQVVTVASLPAPGETVLCLGSSTALGGKGQNQAVAAARSGAETTFIAALGDDGFGSSIRAGLAADGIDASLVRTTTAPTGTAFIAVDTTGENTIIVDSGANALLSGLEDRDASAIRRSDVLVMQLEVPLETVRAAARIARAGGTTVLVNAAPIRPLPDELLADVDILVVNETEAAALAAARAGGIDALLGLVPVVIVTLGPDGAELHRRGQDVDAVPAHRVEAVDATGAGDTFCGALAASIAQGASLELAVRFAVVAASLSVEHHGAVPSIPFRAAIDSRLVETG